MCRELSLGKVVHIKTSTLIENECSILFSVMTYQEIIEFFKQVSFSFKIRGQNSLSTFRIHTLYSFLCRNIIYRKSALRPHQAVYSLHTQRGMLAHFSFPVCVYAHTCGWVYVPASSFIIQFMKIRVSFICNLNLQLIKFLGFFPLAMCKLLSFTSNRDTYVLPRNTN